MKQSHFVRLLLLPSPLSLVCAIVGADLLVASMHWTYIHAQPFFVTYFSGQYGLFSVVYDLNRWLGQAAGSTTAYNVAVIFVSALIGLGLYSLLEGTRHMITRAHLAVSETHYINRPAAVAGQQLGLRLGLRLVTLLAWIGYGFLFVTLLLPLCTAFIQATPQTIGDIIVRNLAVDGVLALALHAHIVFLRLCLLRPRIFGADITAPIDGGHMPIR